MLMKELYFFIGFDSYTPDRPLYYPIPKVLEQNL